MANYTIHYRLSHANGAVVDQSNESPLQFEIGDGQLDPCLEACVKTAVVGKLQTFLLTADSAFGATDEAAIQILPRAQFPANLRLEVDAAVEFHAPNQAAYVGCIRHIDGDQITVDFNHPLAGCDIAFRLKIIKHSA